MDLKRITKKELADLNKDQEKMIADLQARLEERNNRPRHEVKAAERADSEAKNTLSLVTQEDVATIFEKASEQIDNAKSTLLGNVEQGRALLEALKHQKERLLEDITLLHGKEAVLAATETILQNYNQAKAELEAEIKERREDWSAQVKAREEAWKLADEERDEEIEAADEEIAERRKREREEYEYAEARRRRDAMDAFKDAQKKERAQFEDWLDAQNKDLSERVARITAQEQELSSLRQQAAEWPERLEVAVESAIVAAKAQAEKDCTASWALAEQRLKDQIEHKIQYSTQLLKRIQDQETEIASLRAELAAGQERLVAVSREAFGAVSGQGALAAVKEVATSSGQSSKNGR